ncbi:MAG: SDR family NAD(P)-dependent oxidoreductase [Proteobacteria bacterium]|nr:SDR family NAD(P)-dependent oxidoreductase [Pseudomonadota bacterium]
MKPRLKPLDQQVIVITGGSSGIGLSTARRAAEKGARLVLAARNAEALAGIKADLEALGTEVEYVAADVGDREDVRSIAQAAITRFGGFDTWINDAGAATYGKIVDTPVEDMRRVFDTNFWGIVHGSLEAVEHLRSRPHGGKIINLGSVLSDFAVPEQGPYVASKHAVKGFTHSLRIEMRQMRLPVSVTLIKPSGIDTPYKDHARNRMDQPARIPPIVYAPNVAADAILYACQHDVRDLTVGFGGRGQQLFQEYLPEWADTLFAAFGSELQKDRRPGHEINRQGNLYQPEPDGQERSDHRFVRKFSAYTAAQTHPRTTAGLALVAGAAAAGALLSRRRH